jgi:hypothetical protein
MRQARVTALAGLVPRQRLHRGQLARVAGRTGASVGHLAHEVVRRMQLLHCVPA